MRSAARLPAVLLFAVSLSGGLFAALHASSEDLALFCEDRVLQGEPLAVVLYPAVGTDSVEIVLADPSRRPIARTATFRYTTESDVQVSAAFFGISNTARTGTYTVTVLRGSEELARTTFEVAEQSFFEERVPLNQAMTTLRSAPNPARDAESDAIYRLFMSFNPVSVYHTDRFAMPVDAFPTSSTYGSRRVYLYADGATSTTVHYGTDYATPVGTPVRASGAARVAFAGPRILTGNSVVLEHMPGVYGIYYHLDSIAVTVGQTVQAGQLIGRSGMTGLVTGAHLHFEFRIGGVAIDPAALLRKGLLDKSGILRIIDAYLSVNEGR
jgi:murein DD-endopeptidase MepM/ murein hydrolase activator NlpD